MKITKEYLRNLIRESLEEVTSMEEADGEGMSSRQNIAAAKESGRNLQPGTILVSRRGGEVILITGTVQGTNQTYPARVLTFGKSEPSSYSDLRPDDYEVYVTNDEKRKLFGLEPL